ncbi:short chain dehydrogenase [Fulvimarina pelagi HTCC2506]|uniref:Short chain dehydrogenase n=1 Tax=Fulvimarina pelagi HTCC2506 TaxID=314231 RepID=Q0G5E3_9HYPH|nr:SDR family oxidoreductase [Fulvimarina pelagi]EAU43121.1 short chain dehydrogenase [Fulvimarina pelagi HTCC2506]
MGRYLIYGGNGGIGSAIAHRLSKAGHDLVLAGRNTDELKTLGEALSAKTIQCDVMEEGSIDACAQEAGNQLDGLCYAVGSINLKPFAKVAKDDILTDFRLNALGAAQAFQASATALTNAENGASALFFSTVAVDQGFAAHVSIAMAKGAVVGLVRTLATEYAPKIRVNAIAPSLVDSPLGQTVAGNDKMADAVAKMHAIPRLGKPDDIAAMGELLLTDSGSWITGQVIGVDGGRSAIRVMRS